MYIQGIKNNNLYPSASLGNDYYWHFKSALASSSNYYSEFCVCHSLVITVLPHMYVFLSGMLSFVCF